MDLFRRLLGALFGKRDTFVPTVDIPSPRDIVPNENITFNQIKQQIIIKDVKGIWLTTVQDTNSMDAVMDYGHTCILTSYFKVEDLGVGDVIVYWSGTGFIIHRIIGIDQDEEGVFFACKGDNNYYEDPYKIRKEHIHWLLIGVVY